MGHLALQYVFSIYKCFLLESQNYITGYISAPAKDRHPLLEHCYIIKYHQRAETLRDEDENDDTEDIEISIMADLQEQQQQHAEKILAGLAEKVKLEIQFETSKSPVNI